MSDGLPKVFIDTNVWFSYLYGSKNCESLANAHTQGKIKAVISRQVLEEIVRNLKEKIPTAIPVFEKFIETTPPAIIKDPLKVSKKISELASHEDIFILGSAFSAKVKCFVTGNVKDFNVEKIFKTFGIKVLTPNQAVEEFDL